MRALFPTEGTLPANVRVGTTALDNRYLVDGELRTWSGESAEVRSPICLRKADGTLERLVVGRMAQLEAALVDALVNQVSRINLNTQCRRGPDTFPFTGRKDSAEGTLSVFDALRAFSIRTVVASSSTEENKELVSGVLSGRLSSFLSTDFIL